MTSCSVERSLSFLTEITIKRVMTSKSKNSRPKMDSLIVFRPLSLKVIKEKMDYERLIDFSVKAQRQN